MRSCVGWSDYKTVLIKNNHGEYIPGIFALIVKIGTSV